MFNVFRNFTYISKIDLFYNEEYFLTHVINHAK